MKYERLQIKKMRNKNELKEKRKYNERGGKVDTSNLREIEEERKKQS